MIIKCLPRETAEIDPEYECIGYCGREVVVVPEVDLSFAVKGMRGDQNDCEASSQHTMYLSYKPPSLKKVDLQGIKAGWLKNADHPLSPGMIYAKDGVHFIELTCELPIGILTMNIYFLVAVADCSFGCECDGEVLNSEYELLWDTGLIKGAAN